MTTPSSPITFGDIYIEANGTAPVSDTYFNTLATGSYFQGPNGNNTIAYNAWGQSLGNDGIYAVQALPATPIEFNNYRSVAYYYDQINSQISLQIIGFQSLSPPNCDFTVTLRYMDSTLAYTYAQGSSFVPVGSTYGPIDISTPTTPLIYGCNWQLEVNPVPPYAGGANVNMDINGIPVLPGAPINPGPPQFWDYNGFANEFMQLNQPNAGQIGSLVVITIT
jgi:hypothetical protein